MRPCLRHSTVRELDSASVPQVFKALRGGVQVVAVKLLHDAEVGGMNFVREIAILKGCRHTNIVQFQASANFSLQVLWSCIDCGARAVSILLKNRLVQKGVLSCN